MEVSILRRETKNDLKEGKDESAENKSESVRYAWKRLGVMLNEIGFSRDPYNHNDAERNGRLHYRAHRWETEIRHCRGENVENHSTNEVQHLVC